MPPTGVAAGRAFLEHPQNNDLEHPNWALGFARPLTPATKADAWEATRPE